MTTRHGLATRFFAEKEAVSDSSFPMRYIAHDLKGPVLLEVDGRLELAALSILDRPPLASQYLRLSLNTAAQRLLTKVATPPASILPSVHEPHHPAIQLYSRIAEKASIDTLPSTHTLARLAHGIKSFTPAVPFSKIPSIYTYLGQFISHDVSRLECDIDRNQWINTRTHALDLDSLFSDSRPHADDSALRYHCEGGACVGTTASGDFFDDLARDPNDAKPLFVDERNDNNLVLSQLTVLLLKFYQVVFRLFGRGDIVRARNITLFYLHGIVLYDFLPRIICPAIYDEVMRHGRALIFPGSALRLFQVPLEFSLACFRFGHSMVRGIYDVNDEIRTRSLNAVLSHTQIGGMITAPHGLMDDWRVGWDHFSTGSHGLASPQMSWSITCRIADDLESLPSRYFDDLPDSQSGDRANLALVTLLRGHSAGIPDARTMMTAISNKIIRYQIASREEFERTSAFPVDSSAFEPAFRCLIEGVCSGSDREFVYNAPPLWFYVLAEAELLGCGRLGPLASRVVMETLHAAIDAASVETAEVTEEVISGLGDRESFDLPRLISVVNTQWKH